MITNELKLYSRSECNIWTDKYIAKNMLLAHLDYEHDGASRNIKTINKTVKWIDSVSEGKKRLIDLGCGPGIYANLLYEMGYTVIGLDISETSIDYAMRWAKMEKKSIDYRRGNYINDKIEGKYDIAICIYCDFGALIPKEQKVFLKNVYRTLNKDGILILDVFGNGLKKRKELRKWTYVQGKDFWSAKPHFLIEESKHFRDQEVWGSRTIIIDDKKEAKEYIMWDHYYSEEKILKILRENGFGIEEVNRDLVRKNKFTSNDVLFVKARKI